MELHYRFAYDDGKKEDVAVRLDPESLQYMPPPQKAPLPEWTKLEHEKCPNCPLKAEQSPRCPVAVNLAPLVERFRESVSFETAEISVEVPGRTYHQRAPMQTGLSALFGLIMATSGCPILDKMRPMVYTHLPFPSLRETQYRSMSMYLLAQFIASAKGVVPDWTLEGLADIYKSINAVNTAFCRRFYAIDMKDAGVNALVKLDCFAAFTANQLRRGTLKWLEDLYRPYWEKKA